MLVGPNLRLICPSFINRHFLFFENVCNRSSVCVSMNCLFPFSIFKGAMICHHNKVWNGLSAVNKRSFSDATWVMSCQNRHPELQKSLSNPDTPWCHSTSPLSSVTPFCPFAAACLCNHIKLLSVLPPSIQPVIPSNGAAAFLIKCLYIYYSFDWLELIASQVAEINHYRNPIICVQFWDFWWKHLENLSILGGLSSPHMVELCINRGASWNRYWPKTHWEEGKISAVAARSQWGWILFMVVHKNQG